MPETWPATPLQRRHEYVYVVGSVPVHVPVLAVRVSPSAGVPEIVGGA